MMPNYISVVDIAVLLAFGFFVRHLRRMHVHPLPPGPTGWPLIGNLFDMPKSHEWKTFAQWGEKWGDVVSVSLLGQTMVILNSPEHAVDMLEKKSAIYSDRPRLTLGGRLVGWDQTLVLTPYGARFRHIRRLLAKFIGGRTSVAQYAPLLEHETSSFISRTFYQPDSLREQVRHTAGSIILMLGYGYKAQAREDSMIKAVDLATHEFSALTAPGAFLVDVFPILEHVPAWFPGTGWKSRAKKAARGVAAMCNNPHQFVREQMAVGAAIPSFTSLNLEEDVSPEFEDIIKGTAASLYSGGADTTVSAICSFFLAMMCFPEVQKKAQREIDTLIGHDRLPELADRERLPYVNALCSEVLRWNPVDPLSIPHRLTEDDMYAGYFLPKGTLVVANIWKFLHDSRTYVDPFAFNPDRYISTEGKQAEPDPRATAFGFGRRICPGMYLADASIFLSCAMSLAVFDISKPVENGVVVEPVIEYTTGTISHPQPFKCSIKCRSAKAEALILATHD